MDLSNRVAKVQSIRRHFWPATTSLAERDRCVHASAPVDEDFDFLWYGLNNLIETLEVRY